MDINNATSFTFQTTMGKDLLVKRLLEEGKITTEEMWVLLRPDYIYVPLQVHPPPYHPYYPSQPILPVIYGLPTNTNQQ